MDALEAEGRLGGHTMDSLLFEWSRLESNCFGVYPPKPGDKQIGRACFPLAALLNHSCDPNCSRASQVSPWILSFQTTREVAAGEELCISYIDTNLPRSSRQYELKSVYSFDCLCERCVQEGESPRTAGKMSYAKSSRGRTQQQPHTNRSTKQKHQQRLAARQRQKRRKAKGK